jgi:hypothetical protein
MELRQLKSAHHSCRASLKAAIVLIFSGLGLVAFQAVFSFRKRYVVQATESGKDERPAGWESTHWSLKSTEPCSVTICPILVTLLLF